MESDLSETLRSRLRRFRDHVKQSNVGEISRRYFVMNAFDGAMTMLGVIIGAYLSTNVNPRFVVGAGLGACLAMGVSGFSGAYMAEKAMRTRQIKELERAMFTNLEGTRLDKASRAAMLWVALVDGLSPALAALISMSPFILATLGLVSSTIAIVSSIALTLGVLFILGVYLGRLSQENALQYGVMMTLAGIAIALVLAAFSPP